MDAPTKRCSETWSIAWPGHGNAVLRHVHCKKRTKHPSGKCHHHRAFELPAAP